MNRPRDKRFSPARSFALGAAFVLLVFAVMVPVLIAVFWTVGSPDLVVVAFDAHSGEPALDQAFRTELAAQLQGMAGVRVLGDIVLPADTVRPAPAPRWTRRSLCGATGADYVFSGEMSRADTRYVVGIQVQSCSSGERLLTQQVQLEGREQLPEAVSWLASVARRLAS